MASVKVVNATYPKNHKSKKGNTVKNPVVNVTDSVASAATRTNRSSSERVYVVTPIPIRWLNATPSEISDYYSEQDSFGSKESFTRDDRSSDESNDLAPVERVYQVLPQAVNNLAVSINAPQSAAPALWGIMEHEDNVASGSLDQPRWGSELDALPHPDSTPVLYDGHSKVN